MTRGKFIGFAAAAVCLSTVILLAGLLAVDLYLHHRHDVNIWGYRGPVAARKAPGEQRIVVVGESTAFGYGVPWAESFPAVLERDLNIARARVGRGPVSVVNLAYNNEGAYSFQFTLRDYAYLDYDVVLFYTGYNDVGRRDDLPMRNLQVVRHRSPVFRLTGYWPLIGTILPRKADDLRATAFRPDLATRATADALEATARITASLEAQVGRLTQRPETELVPRIEACTARWAHYCGVMSVAVESALDRGHRVVVVTQPYISDRHVEQQQALLGMLRERFGRNPRVRHVNLGPLIDLADRSLAFDGMHLTAPANARVAAALVSPLLEVLE